MKRGLVLGLFLVLLLTVPVVAATYTAPVTLTEEGTTGYDMLPVSVAVDNDNLVDLGIMSSTGLDTRVLQGSTELPHMVVNDYLWFALPVVQGNQYPLKYTFGNTALSSFPVIVGDGGYIVITDDADLELDGDFEIEYDGWVDTTAPTYPKVEATTTGYDDSSTLTHVMDVPAGAEEGDLLIIMAVCYGSASAPVITWPSGFINLDKFSHSTYSQAGAAYKFATGSEGSTVTTTSSTISYCSWQVFRISGATAAPAITAEATDYDSSPNSAGLNPSGWNKSVGTLWISFFAMMSAHDVDCSGYPSGYGDGLYVEDPAASFTAVGSARKQSISDSDDPGAFTLTGIDTWGAWTIAVKGSEYLVNKTDSFSIMVGDVGEVLASIPGIDISQTITGGGVLLYNGSYIRAGEKFTSMPMGYIDSASVYLTKVGSPTGTAYVRLRKVSDDSEIGTFGSIDASTVTAGTNRYDFTTPVFNPTAQAARVTIEFNGGSGGAYIFVNTANSDELADAHVCRYISSWDDTLTGYDLTFELDYRDCIGSATSITAGDHNVKAAGDGTDMKLYIDDVEKDSETIRAASDSDNGWLISGSYFNSYTHTTSDTLRLTYEPDSIIVDTTLPNEEFPGTYDGAITFGSNPSNVSTTLGALLPVETSAASASADETQPSFVPDTGDTTWVTSGIEGENLPLYGFFKGLFATYHEQGGPDISMPLFWKVVAVILAWAFGTAVLVTTKQVAFAFIAYVAGFAVPAYYMGGLLDSWLPIVYGLGAVCLAALTWKWTSSSMA